MRKTSKIITAIALAGLAVAGGAAFTATGVSSGKSGEAPLSQSVGGQVTQTVTGAHLMSVVYGYSDTTSKTTVNKITLTFGELHAAADVSAMPWTGTVPTSGTSISFTQGTGNTYESATSPALSILDLVLKFRSFEAVEHRIAESPNE